MARMAKKLWDKGVDKLLVPAFDPGELLVAATIGENSDRQGHSKALARGGIEGKIVRDTVSLVAGDKPAVKRPGLGPSVYVGEVMVALTIQRLWFFPRKGKQVFLPTTAFRGDELLSVKYTSFGAQMLTVDFVDGTKVVIHLPTWNFAKQIADIATRSIVSGVPASPTTEPVTPLPSEPPPPRDWLASPPSVVQESARFAEPTPSGSENPPHNENETP